jgi:hypothetical protein
MGKKGRERFLSTYTLDKHLLAMESSIKEMSGEGQVAGISNVSLVSQ